MRWKMRKWFSTFSEFLLTSVEMIAREEKNVVSQQACEELMTKMDKDSSFIVVKRESSSTKHYGILSLETQFVYFSELLLFSEPRFSPN